MKVIKAIICLFLIMASPAVLLPFAIIEILKKSGAKKPRHISVADYHSYIHLKQAA